MVNITTISSSKKVFIIATIALPIVLLSLITIGYSGLAGINPDNHGKTLVYSHFSASQAEYVRALSVYALVPLTIVTGLLAVLNLKFAKQSLNLAVLLVCLALVAWLFFAFWAIDGNYTSVPDNTDSSLRIRSLNLR